MEVFLVLLECLIDTASALPWTAVICLKELYLLLYRSKILLDYCSQSSKLWLSLHNHPIWGHFHDLNQEISTLLDVFPIEDVELGEDVGEQIELLQRLASSARLFIDKGDEKLRIQFFRFLHEFEKDRTSESDDLRLFFVWRDWGLGMPRVWEGRRGPRGHSRQIFYFFGMIS